MHTSENNQPVVKAKKSLTGRNGNPLLIAGPCSAETPEQIMETASKLAKDGRVDYFRAGIWKPRTSPNSFEGVGEDGLHWLQDVKQEYGLKVTTEVGNEKHVELALKNKVDMLWIGARTVSNPFVVQGIADALRGVDIPVLVKNPLSPDIDLWEGAMKRFLNSGVTQLGAIHRGFFWWGKSHMRNQPFWHIPFELRQRLPEIPIICDPSHIAGKRNLVPLIAQRALENQLSGLMIEVHPDPERAWSDAAQQLTPQSYLNLIDELLGISPDTVSSEILEEIRSEIDVMDEMLVWALAARMELSGKIAKVKKNANIQPLQQNRWQQVVNRVRKMGERNGLDPDFIEEIFDKIHDESLELQKTFMSGK